MAMDFNRLTPTEFENLTYDLLSARGLANATWRTPGADGGRDIEGRWSHVDLSGEQTTETWYVDCKRYAKSVDWPTVFNKLSYAVSNSANYLLIVCTPSISPACRTEANRWNEKRASPLIRVWEAHYLEVLLAAHPDIAAKYGYADKTVLQLPGFLDVVMEANKAAAAAYTRAELLTEQGSSKELEYAASLADFSAEKMKLYGIKKNFLEITAFCLPKDGYEWLRWSGIDRVEIDRSTVRTILCFIRLLSRSDVLKVEAESSCIKIFVPINLADIAGLEIVKKICLIGNSTYTVDSNSISLRSAG